MTQRFFVTSTGTGVGKSFITASLVRQARALGRSVAAYKPVICGFDPLEAENSDTGHILESLELPLTPENIEHVSPWRYAAPLAPSISSRLENRPLDFDAMLAYCKKAMQGPEECVLIEGIGGVMSPLSENRTVIDWIEALGIPVLIVVGTYLNGISHALTALTVLQQRKIPVRAVIVNESEVSLVSILRIAEELKHWTELPLMPIARRKDGNWREDAKLRELWEAREDSLPASKRI
jgi:dethiobiotin synthetase